MTTAVEASVPNCERSLQAAPSGLFAIPQASSWWSVVCPLLQLCSFHFQVLKLADGEARAKDIRVGTGM